VAPATPAARSRCPAIGRAYPGGSPGLGPSHRMCPPVSFGWFHRRQRLRQAPHVPTHRSAHRIAPRPGCTGRSCSP
jgi:hypothetical protein